MMKVKQKIIDTSSMLSVSILQSETETEILLFNNSNFLPTLIIKANKLRVTECNVYYENFRKEANVNDNATL